MSEHTPGPWIAKTDMNGRHHDLAIMAEGDEFQGEAWPYHPRIGCAHHGRGSAPRQIAEANARLMAAAPDLLEACLQASAALPTDHGAFETVRNAIKKALNP